MIELMIIFDYISVETWITEELYAVSNVQKLEEKLKIVFLS